MLWSLLCNEYLVDGAPTAMTAQQAVTLTRQLWAQYWVPRGESAAYWNTDNLICVGDTTIAPAF